jgi:hypothetical protein
MGHPQASPSHHPPATMFRVESHARRRSPAAWWQTWAGSAAATSAQTWRSPRSAPIPPLVVPQGAHSPLCPVARPSRQGVSGSSIQRCRSPASVTGLLKNQGAGRRPRAERTGWNISKVDVRSAAQGGWSAVAVAVLVGRRRPARGRPPAPACGGPSPESGTVPIPEHRAARTQGFLRSDAVWDFSSWGRELPGYRRMIPPGCCQAGDGE